MTSSSRVAAVFLAVPQSLLLIKMAIRLLSLTILLSIFQSLSKFPPHSNFELNCHQLKPDSLPYILPVHNQTLQTPRGVAPLQPPAATVMETPAKKEYRPPRGQTPPKCYICHLCFVDGHHYIYDCPKVQL